jgi:hypothetical protein
MSEYNVEDLLTDLEEDHLLPHPVKVRDMMARASLSPENSISLQRRFQDYLKLFGETEKVAVEILGELAKGPRQ